MGRLTNLCVLLPPVYKAGAVEKITAMTEKGSKVVAKLRHGKLIDIMVDGKATADDNFTAQIMNFYALTARTRSLAMAFKEKE